MTTPADPVVRIRSLVAAFNKRDVARSVEHLAATVTWSRGDGTPLQGRDNLAAHLQDLFAAFPDASLTATNMMAVVLPHQKMLLQGVCRLPCLS